MRKISSMVFATLLAAAPVAAAWPAQAQQAQLPTQLDHQMPTQIDQSQSQMQAQFPPALDQSCDPNQPAGCNTPYLALGAALVTAFVVAAVLENQHQNYSQVSP